MFSMPGCCWGRKLLVGVTREHEVPLCRCMLGCWKAEAQERHGMVGTIPCPSCAPPASSCQVVMGSLRAA